MSKRSICFTHANKPPQRGLYRLLQLENHGIHILFAEMI